MYLQIDALGTVYDLEIENLAEVHSEISVQGAAVCSGDFFVVVEYLDEKRAPCDVLSPSYFRPETEYTSMIKHGHSIPVTVHSIIISQQTFSQQPFWREIKETVVPFGTNRGSAPFKSNKSHSAALLVH